MAALVKFNLLLMIFDICLESTFIFYQYMCEKLSMHGYIYCINIWLLVSPVDCIIHYTDCILGGLCTKALESCWFCGLITRHAVYFGYTRETTLS